ncbi:hypothetical protein [Streptomyces sp. NPDC059863]|uniref:hypothetical protein n=1 Tax=unclassified Streptomyces TaxID=2593676 RepID=UPI00365D2A57
MRAFIDATCARIEYQLADDDGTGAGGQWDSVSIGPVSLSGHSSRTAATTGVDLAHAPTEHCAAPASPWGL